MFLVCGLTTMFFNSSLPAHHFIFSRWGNLNRYMYIFYDYFTVSFAKTQLHNTKNISYFQQWMQREETLEYYY